MSVSKVILSIIIVTCGAHASLLIDRISSQASHEPYYDTLGEYYVQDPILEGETAVSFEGDYEEDDYEDDREIVGRQLPQSGEIKLSQDKKSQTWCKVKKVIKQHHEPGFKFFPSSYSEYECLPHTNFDGSSENSIFSSDICAVKGVKCKPLHKSVVFFKWPDSAKSFCSPLRIEKTVKVGCNCVNHFKYHFL